MRARIAAAFFLGCAVGAVALGVVLWRSDALRTSAFRAQEQPLPPAPGALDLTLAAGNQASQQAPLTPPTSQLPQELPAGEADRVTNAPELHAEVPAPGEASRTSPENTELPHLQVPVKGVPADSLRDTFSEVRDGRPHQALDILAPRGTPVLAAAEGNVVKLFTSKPGGLTVYQFDDTKNYAYYYAHLDRYARGLHEGVLLRAGDVLGYVGSTGNAAAKAPHLHFAVFRLGPEKQWWKGTAIDPLPLIQGHQPSDQPQK